MSVRAKFRCVEKQDHNNTGEGSVKLEAVVGGSEENDKFFHWTPSGTIQMGVVNKDAFAQFEEGKEYYLDFTPAE